MSCRAISSGQAIRLALMELLRRLDERGALFRLWVTKRHLMEE
jgi:hypothetical protein